MSEEVLHPGAGDIARVHARGERPAIGVGEERPVDRQQEERARVHPGVPGDDGVGGGAIADEDGVRVSRGSARRARRTGAPVVMKSESGPMIAPLAELGALGE